MTPSPTSAPVDDSALGGRYLLGGPKLALFCSVKCPAKLIV